MRLIQCVASRTGLFRNRKIDFSDKVTVIYGPNDSGKTFLANILSDLSVSSFLPDAGQPRIDWNRTHVDLVMEHDGATFTISRTADESISIREKTAEGESLILSEPPGTIVPPAAAKSAASKLDRYFRMIQRLGVSGFRETAFVESPLNGGRSIDYTQLRKLFLEDESGFYQLRDLMKRTFSENTKPGVPGIIDQISSHEKELKLLEKQVQLSNIQDERRQKMSDEQKGVVEEIEAIRTRISHLESKLSDAKMIAALRSEITAADGEIGCIEQDRALEQEKIRAVTIVRNTLSKIFPKFTDFSQLHRENLSKIQEAYRRIRTSHERLRTITERKSTLRSRLTLRITTSIVLASASAGAVVFVPFIRRHETILFSALGAAAGTVFILILLSFMLYRSSMKRIPEEKTLAEKQQNEDALRDILRENGLTVDNIGTEEIYELLLQYFEEYGLFTEQESDIVDMEATLRTNAFFDESAKQLKTLRAERSEKGKEIKRIFTHLDEQRISAPDEVDAAFISGLENGLLSLGRDLENAIDLLSRLSEELAVESGGSGQERELNDQIEHHRGKLVTLCRRNRIAHYITTLMDESIAKREDILSRRLASQTASIFHRMTSNQYITSINEPAILTFMKGETAQFTTQIAHMICLSLKLALSDRLAEEHISIPLFIDEPAVYMDSARIKNFIEIIGECSKERQIIILSHDRTLCDSAETVIELQPG